MSPKFTICSQMEGGNNAKAPPRSLGMEVENIPEMDKADSGLIIACHAELQFVGFDALGSVYAEHVEVLGSSKKLGATRVRPQRVPTIGESIVSNSTRGSRDLSLWTCEKTLRKSSEMRKFSVNLPSVIGTKSFVLLDKMCCLLPIYRQ